MRLLAQEAKGRTETIDGLKVYIDHSWVLVLPDAAEPIIHLYTEAREASEAERLLLEYLALIERLLQKE